MFNSESERILEAAVAGLARLAKTILRFQLRSANEPLEAVERIYQRTVRDLGHAEADPQIWSIISQNMTSKE
jgi:hypothetical protein